MNKIFSCSLNERRTKKSAESKRRNLRDGFSLCSSSRCRRSGRSACKRNNSILVRFAQNGSMHARGYQTDRPCARHPRVHRRTPAVFVHRRTPAVFVHAPTACSKRIKSGCAVRHKKRRGAERIAQRYMADVALCLDQRGFRHQSAKRNTHKIVGGIETTQSSVRVDMACRNFLRVVVSLHKDIFVSIFIPPYRTYPARII